MFGSGTLLCFVIQVMTGICLAFVYAPTANDAWTSLVYLNYQQPLGWYLRAMHYWGSNFMVAIMTLHMMQVFLFGAYKYPRELTWISGCILLLCTLGMAFTGQTLRFDEDAYWGLGIGASIMGRTPFIGARLVQLMLAGPIIAGETLSRFFTLHVFVIPGLIIALVSLHLRLVLTKGINEYPQPGKLVRKETYVAEYEELVAAEGVPFVPKAIGKDLIFSALLMMGILACSAVFGPAGPSGPPDPTQINAAPRAGFLLFVAVCPDRLTSCVLGAFLLLVAPVIAIGFLFVLPFLSSTGEKSPRRRPVAVLSVMLILMVIGLLAYLGTYSPWSPQMEAWSGAPVPVEYVKGRTPPNSRGPWCCRTSNAGTVIAWEGRVVGVVPPSIVSPPVSPVIN